MTETTKGTELETKASESEETTYEVLNTGLRELKRLRVPDLETSSIPLFVKEWGILHAQDMLKRIKAIYNALRENNVIGAEVTGAERIGGILAVIENNFDDFVAIIQASTYTTSNCAANSRPNDALFSELGYGDVFTILRAVWAVNFEYGSLAKKLKSLGIDLSLASQSVSQAAESMND